MAVPERRQVHPVVALFIATSVAGVLAFLLLRPRGVSVQSPSADAWFRNVGGRALYLDEPPNP